MPLPRHATFWLTLPLTAALASGCKPGSKDRPVQPPPDGGASPATAAPGAGGPRPPVELIHIEGHLHELDAMLDGVDRALASWTDEGGNWKAQAQAIMLSTGYGPGMLDALALDGQFAGSFAYPHPGQAHAVPGDATLAVSVPTTDNRALIDAMPASYRPQPLGEGMWELLQGDLRILMRETPSSMQVGFDQAQLDQAGQLAATAPAGRRLQVKAWNIPKDDIDPNTVLRGRGGGDFAQRLGEVIKETTSITAEFDMGADRDLQALARVEAPFDRLPLEVYGAPSTTPSDVAGRLPAGAVSVVAMSWGDPAPLHRGIDRTLDAKAVPPPFDAVVEDVVSGTHAVLDGIEREVVMAVYLDEKGEGTVVIGAKIKDEAKATKGLRAVMTAAERAISGHIALVGDDPEYKYRVDYKEAGVSVPGGKADRLTVTVPEFMREDTKSMNMLLGAKKPRFEIISYVHDGYGFLAVGVGGRKVISKAARGIKSVPAESIETDGGLTLAREASGGCSICSATDVRGMARLGATVIRDGGEAGDAGDALVASADALEIDAAVAMGFAVVGNTGTFAVGVPQALLFAARKDAKAITDLIDQFTDPPPAPAKPAKPGKAPR